MRSKISAAENEHLTVAGHLKSARQAHQYLTALEGYRQRAAELTGEGQRLNAERDALEQKLGDVAATERQLVAAEANLRAIDDPRSRVRFLENETKREPELREGATRIEKNLERLENDRQITVEQLESYRDLDEHWSALSNERDTTADGYRTFIANEAESKLVAERQTQLAAATEMLAEVASRVEIAENELVSASKDYDMDHHAAEKGSLLEAERKHAGVKATMDAAKRRAEQLAAELTRFAEIRRSIAGEFKEKERLEKVAEVTAFIRDTLKEAAPRVARNYVHHVSLEANLMYREITGNAERTLKWGEDYAIMLEEDGYERPFQSLSGGEQMAAALSVRLALLKQLTDIRIAFFDEPTTNMDAERRENLAMQISRITHFDQLFVISHDETFDSYVDNVVNVGE
jgi:exonuclease SbcC